MARARSGRTVRTVEGDGPRTWVVIGGMVLAVAVLGGGVFGYLAWQDGDDGAGDREAAPATTLADGEAVIDPEAGILFTRTTAAGIELRAASMIETGQDPQMWFGIPNGPDTPDHCRVVDAVTAVAVGEVDVLQAQLPVTKVVPSPMAATVLYSSMGTGSSVAAVAVQVEPVTTMVRLRGPDGQIDEMAPVNGVAVVALPADVDEGAMFEIPDFGDFVITAHTGDGRSRQLPSDDLEQGLAIFVDPECFGGMDEQVMEATATTIEDEGGPFAVDLPPVGPTQPADPAAARAAIQATFDEFYGVTPDAVLRLVDDPFAMGEMIDEIGDGVFRRRFDDAAVTIEDLVFLSDTEAAIDYELDSVDETHGELFGRARFVGGRWTLTRGTACEGLEFFEVSCPS